MTKNNKPRHVLDGNPLSRCIVCGNPTLAAEELCTLCFKNKYGSEDTMQIVTIQAIWNIMEVCNVDREDAEKLWLGKPIPGWGE